MSRSKRASTARCFSVRTIFSVAAPIRWRTSTIRPGRGTRLPAAWPDTSPGRGRRSGFRAPAPGGDLRERAGELQRRSLQPRSAAQPNERGNRRALRDVSAHEPVRGFALSVAAIPERRILSWRGVLPHELFWRRISRAHRKFVAVNTATSAGCVRYPEHLISCGALSRLPFPALHSY